MAVIKNRKSLYVEKIAQLSKRSEALKTRLHQLESNSSSGMDVDVQGELPQSIEEAKLLLEAVNGEMNLFQQKISFEEEKFKNWKVSDTIFHF